MSVFIPPGSRPVRPLASRNQKHGKPAWSVFSGVQARRADATAGELKLRFGQGNCYCALIGIGGVPLQQDTPRWGAYRGQGRSVLLVVAGAAAAGSDDCANCLPNPRHTDARRGKIPRSGFFTDKREVAITVARAAVIDVLVTHSMPQCCLPVRLIPELRFP